MGPRNKPKAHPDQPAQLHTHLKGESDLYRDRRGRFYLIATIDLPEPAPVADNGFLGVDLGLANVAVTAAVISTGQATGENTKWSGTKVTKYRRRQARLRAKLQRKHTKSATRLLRKRSQKETGWMSDINHQISKNIVAEAERTGRGPSKN